MHERVARDVMLMRAIETTDQKREILSEEDRKYASSSARELAQWHASSQKSDASLEHFLQYRAEQILKKIGERYPSVVPLFKNRSGARYLMILLPALALLAGVGMDRIGNPHRVDLLSAPLLLIIAWNLLVYVVMLVYLILPLARSSQGMSQRLAGFWQGKTSLPRKLPHALGSALLSFSKDWAQLGRKLTLARINRTLHLAAALFALGAILSLYARGLLFQYVAGWESTFLDANQVHAILSLLFTPAVAVFPIQDFTLAEIEALRFRQQPSPLGGERWVHLYAATLFLLVMLPRLLFALIAHFQAKRQEKNFPLDLQYPYFRKLAQSLGNATVTLRVLPYSFTLNETRHQGLTKIAVHLLGDQAKVMLRPSSTYGEESADALRDLQSGSDQATLTAILFNLAATPEKENHGAFLDDARRAFSQGIAVLIDESAFLERAGTQAGGQARVAERVALWEEFCHFHHTSATIVNLVDPQARPVDPDLGLKFSTTP